MKKRGFTLIELVVVLAIISIVSAIAITRFNIIDNFKANIELQTLINDCDYAKMKAISTGEEYILNFGKHYYYIVGASTSSTKAPIRRNLDNIYFSYHNMPKSEIRFTKSGTVSYAGKVEIKEVDKVKIEVPESADDDKLVELRVRVGLGYVRYKK